MRGSTSGTTDSGGTLTSTISYFSFGSVRSSTGVSPTDKKFTGQRLDNTGLYYYNARYYDPAIGRFISADTIVPNPANPQSLNRYSYCLNNPLKYIDPSGNEDVNYDYDYGPPPDYYDFLSYLKAGGDYGYSDWHSGQEFLQGFIDSAKNRFNTFINNFSKPAPTIDEQLAYFEIERYWTLHPDELIKALISVFGEKSNSSYGKGEIAFELFEAGFSLIIPSGGGKGGSGSTAIAKMLNGQMKHRGFMADLKNPALGMFKEFRLPSGKRIDFLDVNNGIVYELKPNNPRALMEGQTQLNGYIQELQTMPRYSDIQWKGVVVPY